MAKLGREATKRRGRGPKQAIIGEVSLLLESGHGFVLLNNKGLTLAEATALRAKLRENKVALKVVKNTLLKIALEKTGTDPGQFGELLTRETVIAVGLEDPVTPAKVLVEFCKDNEKLQIKGGYVDGQVLDAAAVDQLSKLPGREELYARMLGSLLSPIQKFVYALNDGVARPVRVFDAIGRKKEEEGGGAAA